MRRRTRTPAVFLAAVVVAVAASAVPTTADTHANERTSIDQVLDRWAEAVGGRAHLSGVQTLYTRSTVKMYGMEGTQEEWVAADGRHRLDLDLAGVVKVSIVNTATACWFLDQNGKVSEQSGKNLMDEVRDVYLATNSHLLPGRMPGKVELLGADPASGHVRAKILPDGGTEAVFWIDPRSNLPARWESPGESGEIVTTVLSDWHEFDGVLFPTRSVQSSSTSSNVAASHLTEVRVNEPVPAGIFDRPAEKGADYQFAAGRKATDIPLEVVGVHLFVQGRLNDSDPLWFLLDSGAEMTCIDQQVAQEAGLALEGQTAGSGNGPGEVDVSFVRDASFRFPGVTLTNQTVAALELRSLIEARFGHEVDGILGYDFISRFVVAIDYAKSRLHVYERDGWEYRGNGTEVPIWLVDKVPNCKATYTLPNGDVEECNVYVDIGSGTTLKFNKPYTEKHNLLASVPRKIAYSGQGIGGRTNAYRGRIASLRLGDLVFEEPTCSFSQDDKGGRKYDDLAAQLGGGILERCTVILDYERERLFLEPNDRFGDAFPGTMSGLTIVTGGRGGWHEFTVVGVVEGCPGHQADVRAGDVIVAVDGRSADELSMADLNELFRQPGRTITLSVRRGDRVLSKELTMEPVL